MQSGSESPTTYSQANKVVDMRFYKYLVSRKFAVQDDDLIDGLFDEDITEESKVIAMTHGRFNRTKLDIEIKAHAAREEKKQQSKDLIDRVSINLKPHYIKHMSAKLNDIEYIQNNLIQFPEHMHEILEATYSPSATIKSISSVISNESFLARKILQAVNNKTFRDAIGRGNDYRRINKVNIALGYIGIDAFQALLPFLVFKNSIKPFAQVFSGMYNKIWKHCVATAICSNFLLREQQKKAISDKEREDINPFEGYIMAFMSSVGIIAIYHQFFDTFEEVKLKMLEETSERKMFDVYDAIFVSPPSEEVMAEMLISFSDTLPVAIFQHLGWSAFPKSLKALSEEANKIPFEQRSAYGKVLRQSICYSKFELLRRANFFSREHLDYFLLMAGLDKGEMKKLVNQNLRQLDIKMYVA